LSKQSPTRDYQYKNRRDIKIRIDSKLFGNSEIDPSSRWGSFVVLLNSNELLSERLSEPKRDVRLYIDFTERDFVEEMSRPATGVKILVLVEPPAVNPFQYNPAILEHFHKVYSFSQEISSQYGAEYVQFIVPNRKWTEVKEYSRKRPNIGIIAANKNSFHPKSQYFLRRNYIAKLSESKLSFSFAGPFWEKSRTQEFLDDLRSIKHSKKMKSTISYRNFRFLGSKPKMLCCLGAVDSKEKYLQSLDVEICIENCKGELSEKLFDSLQSNTVPAYIGVKLSDYGIPNEIALHPPLNPIESTEYFQSLSWREIEETRICGQEWWALNKNLWLEDVRMAEFAKLVRCFIESAR
jgi:hypothetical protein